MATITLPNAQAPVQRTPLSAGQPVTGSARYTLGQALSVGDIVEMFRVPQGARIKNWRIFVSGAGDTNGTPTFAFNLGDKTNPTRFAAAATVARAGGVLECAVGAAPKGFQYTGDDTVILTVTTAPATLGSGVYIDVDLDYNG